MDKLKSKLNYYKEIGCSLNAEEVKKILSELENTQSDLYEANHRIIDLLLILGDRDRLINEMLKDIYGRQIECNRYFKDIEDVRKYFEERCK